MIKSLTKVGNSKAIVIDKTLLQAAGLDENTLFQVTVNPGGGIIIQSLESVDEKVHKKKC